MVPVGYRSDFNRISDHSKYFESAIPRRVLISRPVFPPLTLRSTYFPNDPTFADAIQGDHRSIEIREGLNMHGKRSVLLSLQRMLFPPSPQISKHFETLTWAFPISLPKHAWGYWHCCLIQTLVYRYIRQCGKMPAPQISLLANPAHLQCISCTCCEIQPNSYIITAILLHTCHRTNPCTVLFHYAPITSSDRYSFRLFFCST